MLSIKVDGADLPYIEQGTGSAVVLSHGALSDYRAWHGQMDALATSHRVIAYSRRGYYPSEPGAAEEPGLDRSAEDLAALIRGLDAAPAHIVGHSYGAFTALLVAARQPDWVRSLVLIEPPVIHLIASNPSNPASLLPLLRRSPRAALSFMKFGLAVLKPSESAAKRGKLDEAGRLFLMGTMFAPIDRLPAPIATSTRDNVSHLMAEVAESATYAFTPALARAVNVPVLLVSGARSPLYFRFLLGRLAASLPNAQHVSIAGAAHYAHWEAPAELNRLVLAHFAANEATAGARVTS
jgi:non-heme chloroperoxidase